MNIISRAAIYTRRSQDQPGVPEDAKAVQRQEDAAREFIAARGWTLHEVYGDKDTSGYLFLGREGFQRMLRDAEARRFTHLVLFDLDRFGRNSRRTMEALDKLGDLGVQVWDCSIGKEVNLDSFEGRLSTTLRAAFAQEYRDSVRKKTAHAMLAKAKRGEPTGKAALGYRNIRTADGRKDWAIDEARRPLVIEIHEPYADGLHFAGIARWLNEARVATPTTRSDAWSSVIVRTTILNPIYRGILVAQKWQTLYGRELGKPGREWDAVRRSKDAWVTMPRPDLRIISEDLEARVKLRLEDRDALIATGRYYGGRGLATRPRYLLSGLLICPSCGFPFDGRSGAKRVSGVRYDVYLCSSRRRRPGICKCDLMLPIAETDAAILDALEREAMGGRLIDELLAKLAPPATRNDVQAKRLDAEREAVTAEISRLVEAIANGKLDADDASAQIAERKARLSALKRKTQPAQPEAETLRAALQSRTSQFLSLLRSEPIAARALIQKLLGPISFGWDDVADEPAFVLLDESKPADGLSAGELGLITWSSQLQLAAFGEGLSSEILSEPIGAS